MMSQSHKRKNTLQYHSKMYATHRLFQKGSWLEKPEERIIRLFHTFFSKKSHIRVLDQGSGIGRHAIPIAQIIGKNGGYVDCVDILPIAIRTLLVYAKQFNIEQSIYGCVSEIEEYVIQANSYDCIVSHSVLTHCKTKDLLIKELQKVRNGIRINGIVYLYFATNQKILDTNNCLLDSEEEVNLSDTEGLRLLHTIFSGWKIIEETVEPYSERIQEGNSLKFWYVDYLVFIAQKII